MPDSPQPRLLVLAANGPTARRTVQHAPDRGHPVVALTPHPTTSSLQHARLTVIGGDATDAQTVLDQLADPTYVRNIAAVCTPGLSVGVATTLRREVLKR